MHPGTIVVALGGNAVALPGERATISTPFAHTRDSLAPVVDLARDGWHIAIVHAQQSLQNALMRAGVPRTVVTVITQTLCDAADPELRHPIAAAPG